MLRLVIAFKDKRRGVPLVKLWQRLFIGTAALALLATFVPGGVAPLVPHSARASSEVVSLAEIKATLGLTDLGISDETLEELLSYPADQNVTIRQLAEAVTVEARYAELLDGRKIKAALGLVEAAGAISSFISTYSQVGQIMLAVAGTSSSWLGIVGQMLQYGVLIPSIIEAVETQQIARIIASYVSVATVAKDAEAWEMIRTIFGNTWFYEREDALYTMAQHAWEARYHQQEIRDAARLLGIEIGDRVNTYLAYRSGQYTAAATTSVTGVIVMNEGEYSICEVVLVHDRLWPLSDEVSETVPEIAPGGNALMAFVPGVEKIDYLEFKVLGAIARVDPLQLSPALPIISTLTTSAFGNYAPREIAFDGSHSLPREKILGYEWDFGDNSERQLSENATHTYQLPGIYSVTLTVSTSGGSATATKTVTVLNPVSASFNVSPQDGPTATLFQFDASASATLAGNIVSYLWDFGGGSPQSDNVTAVHQFAEEGYKSVILTVTNNYGAFARANKTVFVGSEKPTYGSGATAVGADAVWQRDLSNPNIYTTLYYLYDSFAVGADVLWLTGLSNPSINTTASHIYDSFTVGADVLWLTGLSSPSINTTASHIYDSFTVSADAVWKRPLEMEQVAPGDANGDGEVNAVDITKVERIIAGLDVSTPGADANQDGNIDALDITKVERLIVGLV